MQHAAQRIIRCTLHVPPSDLLLQQSSTAKQQSSTANSSYHAGSAVFGTTPADIFDGHPKIYPVVVAVSHTLTHDKEQTPRVHLHSLVSSKRRNISSEDFSRVCSIMEQRENIHCISHTRQGRAVHDVPPQLVFDKCSPEARRLEVGRDRLDRDHLDLPAAREAILVGCFAC